MTQPIPKHLAPQPNSETTNRGQILVVALVVTTVMFILSVALISIASTEYLASNASYKKTQALNLAEAGVEKAIRELNQDFNYTGTEDTPIALDTGEFEIAIEGSGSIRTITSTGYVPDKTNYKQKKIVKMSLLISSETISFYYALQVGTDGIEMENNSVINGNAYSNGNITGQNNSQINGDAYAVNTISSPKPTVTGAKHAGSAPSVLPTLDYDYWKSEANINNDPYIGNYIVNTTVTLGPKKIQGDLTLNTGASLTITGPIWVTGNFTMNSNSNMYLDESFGSIGTVFIVDGTITIASNTNIHSTSATPKGYILIASTSSAANTVTLSSNVTNCLIYALNGEMIFNSNAHANAVVAKKFKLSGNATLDYDTGLADAEFSTGPGGGWTIQTGTWTEH